MAHTILVVDDMVGTRALLRALFEGRGCRVLEACDGGAAFAATLQEMPDLIVMDVEMPNVEGITAASVFHDLASTAHLPIVIYSGTSEEKVGKMVTLGSRLKFVHKSADLSQLWSVVSDLLPPQGVPVVA